jgi:hypothetical protein
MLGDDRVRFCTICSKKVYNLSLMTRAEAELLLSERKGTLCGLIYLRKDGSVMTRDCPVGLKAIQKRIMKRIAGIAAVLLTLFCGQRLITSDNRTVVAVGKMPITNKDGNPTGKVLPSNDFDQPELEALGYIGP